MVLIEMYNKYLERNMRPLSGSHIFENKRYTKETNNPT